MELKDLQKPHPVDTEFRGMAITYNANAFTSRWLRDAAARFKEAFEPMLKPVQKRAKAKKPDFIAEVAKSLNRSADSLDRGRDYYASLLAGTRDVPVLMSWDLTDGGKKVPCTVEGFKRLEGNILQDLYAFIRDHPLPKSPEMPTTKTSRTISGTTDAGSPIQATQPDESRIM